MGNGGKNALPEKIQLHMFVNYEWNMISIIT